MGEHGLARVHPSGKKQHLQGPGHRIGAVVAGERRKDCDALVRMSGHQFSSHLHTREIIA
jgi:hypothetical protein